MSKIFLTKNILRYVINIKDVLECDLDHKT